MVELAAGDLRVVLAPAVGGSIASFRTVGSAAHDGRPIDWLRAASKDAIERRDPLGMASFPLVPFCNRIRNGRASFEGREVRFPPNHPAGNSPHPLHGIGWQRPWTVVSAAAASAELALEVDASDAWPWRFSARQHFTLSDTRLDVRMSITNLDNAAMPAGIGHHPYYPRTPGTRMRTEAAAQWVADAEVMPIALDATDTIRQLHEGAVVDDLVLDNNFTGWSRHTRIDWPADAIAGARHVALDADSPLDFFVLYTPRGADHFCAEPVSQCTDWLNLRESSRAEDIGGARLAPGATLDARFSITPGFATRESADRD